jgi:hypothetical protein
MSAMHYYEAITRLAIREQIEALQYGLSSFSSYYLKTILTIRADYNEIYLLFSALISRYIFLLESTSEGTTNPTIPDFKDKMPEDLNPAQKQLMQNIIEGRHLTRSEIEEFPYSGLKMLAFFASLPFPYNMKCLTEGKIEGTAIENFGHYSERVGADFNDRELFKIEISAALNKCNIEAFKEGKFSAIAPELAVAIGKPSLAMYFQDIFLVSQLNGEPPPYVKAWAKNNISEIKNAIGEFIKAIPSPELREQYKIKPAFAKILAMKTTYEKCTTFFSWVSDPLGCAKSNTQYVIPAAENDEESNFTHS